MTTSMSSMPPMSSGRLPPACRETKTSSSYPEREPSRSTRVCRSPLPALCRRAQKWVSTRRYPRECRASALSASHMPTPNARKSTITSAGRLICLPSVQTTKRQLRISLGKSTSGSKPNRSITRKSPSTLTSTISRQWRGHLANFTTKKNCGRMPAAAHACATPSSLLERRRSRNERMLQGRLSMIRKKLVWAGILILVVLLWPGKAPSQAQTFKLQETTIEAVQNAYKTGRLTAHQLVELYLKRIDAYDKKGPAINSIITINPKPLDEADRLDAASKRSGLTGPLHGIPVIVKDQFDVKGMPTTLGSILFEGYLPDRDSFVAEKLRKAGAIILGKTTLGELGGGDTHGSLFGSTRNPYALDRTVGGSSGGSGAGLSANFATIAVGEEGFASIRRPSTWNSVVGMRPTAGLVSRGGMFDGWPEVTGSLGPMARTVTDLARLLDVMAGYDTEDPLTARGVGHIPETYTKFLDKNGLKGARLGILREPMGSGSEPQSADFAKVTAVFDKSVRELKSAGANVVDPISIPKLNQLPATRTIGPTEVQDAFKVFVGRSAKAPFKSIDELLRAPGFAKVVPYAQDRLRRTSDDTRYYRFLRAQDELMTNFMKVLADNKLDAIVYKSVEHQPTLIKDGVNPPFVNTKGVPHLNTFLVFVPAIAVPAGFTGDNLPAGITFMGRPYEEGTILKLAYGYEQATHHRKPPQSTPALPGAP